MASIITLHTPELEIISCKNDKISAKKLLFLYCAWPWLVLHNCGAMKCKTTIIHDDAVHHQSMIAQSCDDTVPNTIRKGVYLVGNI